VRLADKTGSKKQSGQRFLAAFVFCLYEIQLRCCDGANYRRQFSATRFLAIRILATRFLADRFTS
jgi:hypothetical protein